MYKFLNLDISWFKAPNSSSLQYYVETIRAEPSILVHNTFSSQEDIASLNSKAIFWCFCPAANVYIENKLPDYSLFKDATDSLCIGTDSLASNHTLDLISEANLILKNTRLFSIENLLQMMTSNGAKALNLQEQFGQFIPGINTGINQLQFSNNSLSFVKKIT